MFQNARFTPMYTGAPTQRSNASQPSDSMLKNMFKSYVASEAMGAATGGASPGGGGGGDPSLADAPMQHSADRVMGAPMQQAQPNPMSQSVNRVLQPPPQQEMQSLLSQPQMQQPQMQQPQMQQPQMQQPQGLLDFGQGNNLMDRGKSYADDFMNIFRGY